MDFLLDPNIAYLILLAGVMLGFLALITPGTGFFEVGALFCIVLAGYMIFELELVPVWWALILLFLSIVPFVYATQKPKRELFLGLSFILLVIGSIFMFRSTEEQTGVNPIVAVIAAGFVIGFLWIAIRKSIEAASATPSHDLGRLVGDIGEARTKIHTEGSVQVGGELWSARSEKPIKAGRPIRVVRREGFVLDVEEDTST